MEWEQHNGRHTSWHCRLTSEHSAAVWWDASTGDPMPFTSGVERAATGEIDLLFMASAAATLEEAQTGALASFAKGPDNRRLWFDPAGFSRDPGEVIEADAPPLLHHHSLNADPESEPDDFDTTAWAIERLDDQLMTDGEDDGAETD